ncbi:MAG: glycosyltransferase family 4 protein [Ginsengibacter sp.]
MRIAVNAGSLSDYAYEKFLRIAASDFEHTFLFIFDKPFAETIIFPENIVPVVIERKGDSRLKWKFWYGLKIPFALKKHQADIFISEKMISLRTNIPQLLLFPDFTFIHQPSFLDKKNIRFYKKNTSLFLNKAAKVIAGSDYFKKEIIQRYKINEEKIIVLYPEIDNDFRELSFEEKESFKEKYAEGNEYFIYNGIISPQQNLLNLLKAFSFFKKRQKSKMQLIIAGKPGNKYPEFAESLRLFRFKDEVKILENLSVSETEKIIASAYAMVQVPVNESNYPQALQALKCRVPAIVSSGGAFPEYFGDSALYAHPENFRDIADKMMLLFKDEKLRKDLIEKEAAQIEKFSQKKKEEVLVGIIKSVFTNSSKLKTLE